MQRLGAAQIRLSIRTTHPKKEKRKRKAAVYEIKSIMVRGSAPSFEKNTWLCPYSITFRNSGRDSLYVQHDVFCPGIDKLSKGKGNDTLIQSFSPPFLELSNVKLVSLAACFVGFPFHPTAPGRHLAITLCL